MKINIQTDVVLPEDEPRIGNVYPMKGGYGVRDGHMYVIVSITQENTAICLQISKHGDIVGATRYGIHVFRDRAPIAFVEGLDELELPMRSI